VPQHVAPQPQTCVPHAIDGQWQALPLQLLPAAQARPQAPQLSGSVDRLVHPLPQAT
jgi:hypothetical protein